jgi:hypothetical protein
LLNLTKALLRLRKLCILHLKKIHLLDEEEGDEEAYDQIQALLQAVLEKEYSLSPRQSRMPDLKVKMVMKTGDKYGSDKKLRRSHLLFGYKTRFDEIVEELGESSISGNMKTAFLIENLSLSSLFIEG